MTKYLISFPSEAMVVTDEELPEVSADAHAVIEEAKAAGAYVFGGGIDEQVEPVMVSGDGSVSTGTYPDSRIKGGFTVLEPAKFAAASVATRSPISTVTACTTPLPVWRRFWT